MTAGLSTCAISAPASTTAGSDTAGSCQSQSIDACRNHVSSAAHEPAAMRSNNPWAYDWSQSPAFSIAEHAALRDSIRTRLTPT